MDPLPYGKESLVMLAAYALGCFTAGFYLVRWRTGRDIRSTGSGSVGATNVGRLIGRKGFAATLAVDFLKGAFAAWLAEYFQLRPDAAVLVMLAVVAGHIWPVQLRFRGGKGVATCLGALAVYNFALAFTFVILFLIVYALIRNFVLSGMGAFASLPLVSFLMGFPLASVFGLSALAVLIFIAHRRNIPEELGKLLGERRHKGEKRPSANKTS